MESNLLVDSFGRRINYLRVSVTDRCNFQCVYCMPPEGIPHLHKEKILTLEEIFRVGKLFIKMGGKKIKITGGEPLLRKNLTELIKNLAGLPGLDDLGLTTNGYFLKELAKPFKEAGLKRINVSLDSMSPSRFTKLTRCSQFETVWEGIEEALAVGLKTKINVVVMKGISPEEILAFGKMAKRLPIEVRFIEFMPLCGSGWHPEWMLPIRIVRDLLQENFDLQPLLRHSQVAQTFEIRGGEGRLGFIASLTEPFCENCSRIRLTSEGKLRLCLFSNIEIDLKPLLRENGTDGDLMEAIALAVQRKPIGHQIDPSFKNGCELPRIRFVGG